MWITIFFFISIAAFIFSRIARGKAESIVVSYNLNVEEQLIRRLGLYRGLAVRLQNSEAKDVVEVWVTDASGKDVHLGSFTSPIEYDILKRKKINAFVYSISGEIVVIETKLNEAL